MVTGCGPDSRERQETDVGAVWRRGAPGLPVCVQVHPGGRARPAGPSQAFTVDLGESVAASQKPAAGGLPWESQQMWVE